jgi:hypothetical protein
MAKEKSKKNPPSHSVKTVQNPSIDAPKNSTFTLPNWLPLTLILVATAAFHGQYWDIPLERDESYYSYIGKLALNGGKPYLDFYEMKPPVLFYSYAILVGIFGYSGAGIHLAATALAVGNTFFTYAIAKKLGGQQVAYLSAIAYSIWSLSSGVYGAYLMSENIQLIWGLPAILLALNYATSTTNSKQLFAVGVLISLSFLTKQTSGVLLPVVGIYWLAQWFMQRGNRSFFDFFKPLMWTVAGFFTPIVLTIVGLWAIGCGEQAKFWLFDYPSLYIREVSEKDAGLAFGLMQRLVFTGYYGYFIAAVLGLIALVLSKKTLAEKGLLSVWAVFTVLTVGMGKRFYGHYWLFALPVLSILGSLFFKETSDWLRQKKGKLEASIVLSIGVLWSIHAFFTQPNLYFNPSVGEISRQYSPGNPYLEHQVLSNYVEKIIKPTDRLAVFGADPQYFIYLNKTSQIRHVYMPFITNPSFVKAVEFQEETVETFKKTAPDYVILNKYSFAWMFQPNVSQKGYEDIYSEIRRNYYLIAYIENPDAGLPIEIKEPTNPYLMPQTPSYIAVLKRK